MFEVLRDLCESFASFAVRVFNRKVRKENPQSTQSHAVSAIIVANAGAGIPGSG